MWPVHRLSNSLASARLPVYILVTKIRFIGFSILVLLSLHAAYYRIFQAVIKGQTVLVEKKTKTLIGYRAADLHLRFCTC